MSANVKTVTLTTKLLSYRNKYLYLDLESLDESSTRIIVNHLLTDVLGYRELIDIKTEFPVFGGYIDYLIRLNNKNLFVVEVKSANHPLSSKHLRQAIYYAAVIGVEWIILTNGRIIELYQLSFKKPIKASLRMRVDLKFISPSTVKQTAILTKRSIKIHEYRLLI